MTVTTDDRQQFIQILARALRSRGNLLTLARCASQLKLQVVEQHTRELTVEKNVITDIDRGRALWDLLRDATERLRPTDLEPDSTPAWRLYTIAESFYIQGKPAKEVAADLGISLRTFNRERRAAVEAVRTIIWQIEEQKQERKEME